MMHTVVKNRQIYLQVAIEIRIIETCSAFIFAGLFGAVLSTQVKSSIWSESSSCLFRQHVRECVLDDSASKGRRQSRSFRAWSKRDRALTSGRTRRPCARLEAYQPLLLPYSETGTVAAIYNQARSDKSLFSFTHRQYSVVETNILASSSLYETLCSQLSSSFYIVAQQPRLTKMWSRIFDVQSIRKVNATAVQMSGFFFGGILKRRTLSTLIVTSYL